MEQEEPKDPNKIIEDQQNIINMLSNKLVEQRKLYSELIQKSWSFKIRKASDRFWSVLAVFLESPEEGTSLSQKFKMFFKTMWAWARSGFKLSSEQVYTQRLEICKACPQLVKPQFQCKMCGCMMKAKTKVEAASCPLKKW
jgi:hypothetical protein